MGPKSMNCCMPEQLGTKEYGKMLKRIQVLEDGRVLPKEQEIGRLWTKGKNHKIRISEVFRQV